MSDAVISIATTANIMLAYHEMRKAKRAQEQARKQAPAPDDCASANHTQALAPAPANYGSANHAPVLAPAPTPAPAPTSDPLRPAPRPIQHDSVTSQAAPVSNSVVDACGFHFEAFKGCLNSHVDDNSKCQIYVDMLKECRKNSGSVFGC